MKLIGVEATLVARALDSSAPRLKITQVKSEESAATVTSAPAAIETQNATPERRSDPTARAALTCGGAARLALGKPGGDPSFP